MCEYLQEEVSAVFSKEVDWMGEGRTDDISRSKIAQEY